MTHRGISCREAGWRPSFVVGSNIDGNVSEVNGVSGEQEKAVVTLENIHNCSTYQLRQELKRRGMFCNDDENSIPINHRFLLQTMIGILVGERDEKDAARSSPTVHKMGHNQNDRVERKAAAIERSRQRQASAGYFEAKKAANERMKEENAARIQRKTVISNDEDEHDESEPDESCTKKCIANREEKPKNEPNNPFAPTFRPKISGRCFL